MIVGPMNGVQTVSVQPGDGMDAVIERIKTAIEAVDQGAGCVVLCDMFGGTPSNLSLSFLSEQVEVITGVNLPMLIKLFTCRDQPLDEVADMICKHGRDNVLVAGALLRKRTPGEKAGP